MIDNQDTIVAIATAPGTGGIAVIRLSGPDAFEIASKIWNGTDLSSSRPNQARYGTIIDPKSGDALDDCLATPFRGPASFTGEDSIEFSVHGSRWIQREVVKLLIDHGARIADRGEFTRRAFVNGKLDLAQAEGIADLIASSSREAHRLAISQTRGAFSRRLDQLRQQLIDFASLLELELDFSEEDVEFADRQRLRLLADDTISTIEKLADSYSTGRAIKEGVPVVIAGVPNAGKSTLLNSLLEDDKAIVSDIPGTTRDLIEDTIEIDGILFRFIDTAGLRTTEDHVERLGIDRTRERLSKASIIIRLLDATAPISPQYEAIAAALPSPLPPHTTILDVLNKTDLTTSERVCHTPQTGTTEISKDDYVVSQTASSNVATVDSEVASSKVANGDSQVANEDSKTAPSRVATGDKIHIEPIQISAKTGKGIDTLRERLIEIATPHTESDLTITNARHYESLTRALDSLKRARTGLDTTLSADFIAQDIRETLHHLSTLTGAITTPDLLQTIFARFCIGK